MKQIRHNVFETNSSSTHSVSIRNQSHDLEPCELPIYSDGYIHVSLGEFGWEVENYYSQEDKLSYLLTMLCEVNGFQTDWWNEGTEKGCEKLRSQLDSCDDFITLNDEIIDYTDAPNGIYLDDSTGYIDHQSYEGYRSLSEFLNDWGVSSVTEFVFDRAVVVHTDNDNH